MGRRRPEISLLRTPGLCKPPHRLQCVSTSSSRPQIRETHKRVNTGTRRNQTPLLHNLVSAGLFSRLQDRSKDSSDYDLESADNLTQQEQRTTHLSDKEEHFRTKSTVVTFNAQVGAPPLTPPKIPPASEVASGLVLRRGGRPPSLFFLPRPARPLPASHPPVPRPPVRPSTGPLGLGLPFPQEPVRVPPSLLLSS